MTEQSDKPALSAEDRKLVTLARATQARTQAAEGAAVRDLDGRTYAAATVDLPRLKVSAIGVCIAMAVASGSKGLDAVVLLSDTGLIQADQDALDDFGARAVLVNPAR